MTNLEVWLVCLQSTILLSVNHTGFRIDIAVASSVVPMAMIITPLLVIIFILVVLLKKSYNQQKLTHYDYVLPPLPPRLRRTDYGSGIYDSIRCTSRRDAVTVSETAFTTAMIVNSAVCHLSEQTQSTSPSNDLPPSTVDTSDHDMEISAPEGGNNTDVTSRESAGDVMRHSSAADRFGIQSQTRENRTATGNSTAAESEVTRVLDESDNTSCVEERKREDKVTSGESRTEISDGRTVESIHDGQEESAIIIMTQENVSYQPSTTFVLAANPAYGTGVTNVPEIPTEDNVAYQRVCSGDQVLPINSVP